MTFYLLARPKGASQSYVRAASRAAWRPPDDSCVNTSDARSDFRSGRCCTIAPAFYGGRSHLDTEIGDQKERAPLRLATGF